MSNNNFKYFAVALLLSSCAMLITPSYHFVFVNETSKNVILTVFHKGNPLEQFTIDSGNLYDKVINCDHCSHLPFDEKTDSLVISFSDGKSYIQYCDGQPLATAELTKCSFVKDFVKFLPVKNTESKALNKTYQTISIDSIVYKLATLK